VLHGYMKVTKSHGAAAPPPPAFRVKKCSIWRPCDPPAAPPVATAVPAAPAPAATPPVLAFFVRRSSAPAPPVAPDGGRNTVARPPRPSAP
jgi:hypothetical protein